MIEKCIHEAQDRNERTYHVRQRLKKVSIKAELSAYKERNRMKSLVHNALAETEFAETAGISVPDIPACFYTSLLHIYVTINWKIHHLVYAI